MWRRARDGRWVLPIHLFPDLVHLRHSVLTAGWGFGPLEPQIPRGVVLAANMCVGGLDGSVLPSLTGAGAERRCGMAPIPTSAGALQATPLWQTLWPAPLVAWASAVWDRRPLRADVWARVLAADPDVSFIVAIIRNGIRVLGGHEPEAAKAPYVTVASGMHIPSYVGPNRRGTAEQRAAIAADLRRELAAGRLVRPPVGQHSRHVHPMRAVPKGRGPDGVMAWRIVHNLTFPYGGGGVNGHISYVAFEWATIDDLLAGVTPACWMARIDVEAYYRLFPVSPLDWHLLAQRFDLGDGAGEIELWDPYMPFGLVNAVEIAHRTMMGLLRELGRRGHSGAVGIMDDVGITNPTREGCTAAHAAMLALMRELNINPNWKPTKTHGAAQLMGFLGVEVDSVAMEARLGAEKLAKTLTALRSVRDLAAAGRLVPFAQLESLNGLLVWVSGLVYGGRTYLARLLGALHGHGRQAAGPHARGDAAPPLRLDAGCMADLAWWLEFLPRFNGKCRILDWSGWSPRLFSTDADLDTGIGVFVDGGYVGLTFAQAAEACPQFAPMRAGAADPIHTKELYAVLVGLTLFADSFANSAVTLRSDNTAAVAAVNNGASGAVDPRMMDYRREIFWASARGNFRLEARYIATGVNGLADALSRQQWTRFAGLLGAWRQRVARDGAAATIETSLGA